MPYKHRQPKARAHALTEMQRRYFLDEVTERKGLDLLDAQYPGDEWSAEATEEKYRFMSMFWPLQRGDRSEVSLWRAYGRELTEEFAEKYPGYRPLCWWRYDAPRVSDDQLIAWRFQKELHPWFTAPHRHERPCEPRLRLGGTGTPCYEVLAHVPAFHLGLPHPWVQPWDADYYNGRAVTIHGQPIGTEFKEGRFKGVPVDPLDPPVYESSAAYLRRHSLFLPGGEESRLSADAFEPDTLGPEWWSESAKTMTNLKGEKQ